MNDEQVPDDIMEWYHFKVWCFRSGCTESLRFGLSESVKIRPAPQNDVHQGRQERIREAPASPPVFNIRCWLRWGSSVNGWLEVRGSI